MDMIHCPECGDSIGMDEVICPFCSATVYGDDSFDSEVDEQEEGEEETDPREFPFVEGDAIKLKLEEEDDLPYGLKDKKLRKKVFVVTETKTCDDEMCDGIGTHQSVRVDGKRFWYDHCNFEMETAQS